MTAIGTDSASDPACPDVSTLAVDARRDPGGGRLAAAVNAHFALDVATRRRRAWTAVLALLGLPPTVTLVFPTLLAPALRRGGAAAWVLAAVALVSNLVFELRAAWIVRCLRRADLS